MDSLVNLIVGTSTTLDVYVIVRLIVVMIALELFATACGFLGGYEINVIFDFYWCLDFAVAVCDSKNYLFTSYKYYFVCCQRFLFLDKT